MTDEPTSEQRLTPMYASFSTFVTLLDWIKEMPVTPSQIDRSLWQSKFSGSGGAQLIAGLRFLMLLNGDKPTAELEALARADREARKTLLADTLRRAYGSKFIESLPAMTPKMLDETLRDLGTTDAIHRKAVSFFVNAAKTTEIPMPMAIQKRARIRTTVPRRPNATGNRGRRNGGTPPADNPPLPPPVTNMDGLRTKYIEMLMDKANALEEPDSELLDRIESLLGFETARTDMPNPGVQALVRDK